MLLDIGAKTSNLLFFEKGKVYARSINIGANSITQDFGHEAKLRFAEAEAVKLEKGSVSLGGAYEEPEDPQAAAIAKIARQVMTRLHIQVNQTIQFYRGQQGGSAPERLYLSGGASIMPYTAQFFAEKLNLPVDYFNPFRNIEIGPALDLEELSKYAHSFGEVVGLGLRDLAHCPVELNLMPKSSIRRQEFVQKKPYLIAAIFSLALAVFLLDQGEAKIEAARTSRLGTLKRESIGLEDTQKKLSKAAADIKQAKADADGMGLLATNRFYWMKVLTEMRAVLMQAEAKQQTLLTAKNDGQNVDTGVWMQTFEPVLRDGSPYTGSRPSTWNDTVQVETRSAIMDPAERRKQQQERALARAAAAKDRKSAAVKEEGPTDAISSIRITCKLVDRTKISQSANSDLAFAVAAGLGASPSFSSAVLGERGVQTDPEDTNTCTFALTVNLKQPIKF
jgi:Tfp pilus assembly protein PilN